MPQLKLANMQVILPRDIDYSLIFKIVHDAKNIGRIINTKAYICPWTLSVPQMSMDKYPSIFSH